MRTFIKQLLGIVCVDALLIMPVSAAGSADAVAARRSEATALYHQAIIALAQKNEVDYRQAACAFQKAALLIADDDPKTARLYNQFRQTALIELANRFADEAAADEVILLIHAELKCAGRAEDKALRVTLHNSLGHVLLAAGQRRTDPQLLEQAVAAYQNVLLAWRREDLPRQWADTQERLGDVYLARARVAIARGQHHDTIIPALTAYRDALQVFVESGIASDKVAEVTKKIVDAESWLKEL